MPIDAWSKAVWMHKLPKLGRCRHCIDYNSRCFVAILFGCEILAVTSSVVWYRVLLALSCNTDQFEKQMTAYTYREWSSSKFDGQNIIRIMRQFNGKTLNGVKTFNVQFRSKQKQKLCSMCACYLVRILFNCVEYDRLIISDRRRSRILPCQFRCDFVVNDSIQNHLWSSNKHFIPNRSVVVALTIQSVM